MTTATATKMIAVPDGVPSHAVTESQVDDRINAIQAALSRWNTDGAGVPLDTPFPAPQFLLDSVDGLADLLRTTGEIPTTRAAFVLSFDEFYSSFTRWKNDRFERERNPEGRGIWTLLGEAFKRQFPAPPRPAPESPHEVCKFGRVALSEYVVGRIDGNLLRNSAKILGWYDEAGRPDIVKVAEELQSPGKHYDPSTWTDTKHAQRLAELRHEMNLRAVRILLESSNARAKR